MRPQRSDYFDYFHTYVSQAAQNNVMDALVQTHKETLAFIKNIDPALENFAYAPGKWTIKEVLIHCIDTERIFSTRALGFARGETQKALSYDENIYAAHSHAAARTLTDIAEEFDAVRKATLYLFQSFSNQTLALKGEFPSGPVTINAIGFGTCGHTNHHIAMIKERYLKNNS